jgi:hypothetical protein
LIGSLLDLDITPAERWAIFARFPHHHKITCKLDDGFYTTIGFEKLAQYISTKHNIIETKLDKINTTALGIFLGGHKVHKRAKYC